MDFKEIRDLILDIFGKMTSRDASFTNPSDSKVPSVLAVK